MGSLLRSDFTQAMLEYILIFVLAALVCSLSLLVL